MDFVSPTFMCFQHTHKSSRQNDVVAGEHVLLVFAFEFEVIFRFFSYVILLTCREIIRSTH